MNKTEIKYCFVAQDKNTGRYANFFYEDEGYILATTEIIFYASKYDSIERFLEIQDEYHIDLSDFIFIKVKFIAEF